MASDDPMIFQFHSSLQGENFENDINDDHHHHEDDDPHPHSLSRLSVCTNSTLCGVEDEDDDDDDDVDYGMARYMSGLSIESFEGDADGELSDGRGEVPALFSDSENELSSRARYPLPATPPLRRNLTPIAAAVKEYASDNEGKRGSTVLKSRQETKENENDMWRKKCRRMRKERDSKYYCEKNSSSRSKKKEEEEELESNNPSRLSVSLPNSAIDQTSSGATSPIGNWRISSPGDDPRDVKARLKMWAHAVAASASKHGT